MQPVCVLTGLLQKKQFWFEAYRRNDLPVTSHQFEYWEVEAIVTKISWYRFAMIKTVSEPIFSNF